jgi:hypothetical protein
MKKSKMLGKIYERMPEKPPLFPAPGPENMRPEQGAVQVKTVLGFLLEIVRAVRFGSPVHHLCGGPY